MKVMVIVKASRDSEAGELPSERLLAEMGQFNEKLVKAGVMLAGEGLHPSSKGKRVLFSGTDRTVSDGPFQPVRELVAGFWLWKVKSMDEAVEWLKRCPNPMNEASEIEIRPVFEAEDFGEAFTPALREQEASMRAQTLGLAAPRFEEGRPLAIAGFNASYTPESRSQIAAQWQRFAPHLGKVPGQVGATSYGVCWNLRAGCEFDYLSGVEVAGSATLPQEYTQVRLPVRRYAVFTHSGHIDDIGTTLDTIWSKWAPDCGLKLAASPCFERYTEQFDPRSGTGNVEIWVPLEV